MKEKLQKLLAEYRRQLANSQADTYYDECSYRRAQGREDQLEEVIGDLDSILEESFLD